MSCISCKIETRKYKCPRCIEYYCSVNCYKIHKEQNCEPKSTTSKENTAEGSDENNSKTILYFKTQDTVDLKKLEELKHSEELKNLLYNRHLRAFLKEIDEAPNAWKAIKVAMQEPLFLEFANECLKVVEPQEDEKLEKR